MLNTVARTLPNSLTLREALERSRQQLVTTFDARVICLLIFDENAQDWVPKLAEGCVLRPSYPTSELPGPLLTALDGPAPVLVPDLTVAGAQPIAAGLGSGMYLRLDARDETIGLLGLEHPIIGHYDDRNVRLLTGLSEVLALTVDNARWFGRLRSLGARGGAHAHRPRPARPARPVADLHLLRARAHHPQRAGTGGRAGPPARRRAGRARRAAGDPAPAALGRERGQAARGAGPGRGQPVRRTGRRGRVVHRGAPRGPPAHPGRERAAAHPAGGAHQRGPATPRPSTWTWCGTCDGGNFELVVHDDGRGFETARGVRDSAYGLVGMRERADVIGARLTIDSRPGHGTTITVSPEWNTNRRSTREGAARR